MPKPSTRRRWLLLSVAAGLVVGFFAARQKPIGLAPGSEVHSPVAATPGSLAVSAPVLSTPVAAPTSARASGSLFDLAQPANASALDAALPAPTGAIHYVRLNAALIAGKQSPFWQAPGEGRLELPLPDGGSLTVALDDTELLGPDRFTSTGRIEGRPASHAIFAYNEGFLHASIEDPELGTLVLRAATEEFSQLYQIDPALVLPCGGPRVPVIDEFTRAQAADRRTRAAELGAASSQPGTPGIAAAENPQRADVHVMMVYTQSVLTTLSGTARTAALQSAFDAAITKVNSVFATSQITARVRLVKMVETQYDERVSTGGNVQNDALTALQSGTDGRFDGKMDEIHALRDQVGADVVCLALNRADSASIGLSYVLSTLGENANALFAFSVVQYSSIAGTNVVSHEVGHVFGCAHDRANAVGGAGSYPYSYGYTFVASDNRRYRDIMAYQPGTELSYFSNPNISAPAPAPANTPGGIAPGLLGESATAFTIEQNAFEVSTWRLQTQAAPNPGTLINVATRAYVGTGNQVLIGGFVVAGAEPKQILLRGSGLALAPFGVGNLLADPVLSLFSGQTLVAQNNNWSVQASAGDVASVTAAATQTGAFPFVPDSTDAALLLTLPPGAYSAILEGARNSTGIGMVEAYQVKRTGAKIVNLSTRGYADAHGREMIGGFSVQGAAGATKRVLIRVLGPTLQRNFGISEGMEDPYMEIYNAAGELLMLNDDWTTSARTVARVRDDFQPIVRYYSEQQIFATGLAPANRREPGVMIDLLPGNYTIIAKPFEKLDDTPPQVAKPGMIILEVYEINP